MQGPEGTDTQVTWPPNPVGVGSRGHKPLPNKRARRSPTPTPLDPSAVAQGAQLPHAHQPASQPPHSTPQPDLLYDQQQITWPSSSVSEARLAAQRDAAAVLPPAEGQGRFNMVAAPLNTFSQPASQMAAATQASQLPDTASLLQTNTQQAPVGAAPLSTMHSATQRSQMLNTHASAAEAAPVNRQSSGSAQPASGAATQSSSVPLADSALPTLPKQATALPSQQLPALAQPSVAQCPELGPMPGSQLPQAPPAAAGSASMAAALAAAAPTTIKGEDDKLDPPTNAAAAAPVDPSPAVAATATPDHAAPDAAQSSVGAQKSDSGVKRKASEIAPDTCAQQAQTAQVPFASTQGQQPTAVADEPAQKRSRPDDNLIGACQSWLRCTCIA